jgi:hypothetical protein
MAKIIYVAINVIYQLFVFFCLLYANTYINDRAVPENLLWKNNHPRVDLAGRAGFATIKAFILIVEGGFILLLVYYMNRSVLNDAKFVKRTLQVNAITTTCFIGILIWGSFNGYLW